MIRRAVREDSRDISNLIKRTLRQSNSPDYDKDEIARLCMIHSYKDIAEMIQAKEFYVAETKERQIAGCIALVFTGQKAGTALVTTVFVHPGYQGKGIGSALMSYAEDVARNADIRTLMLDSSITAHGFYLKLGFKDINSSADETEIDDLFVMIKSIKQS